MATLKVSRALIWLTLSTCISLCFASPTRRQFVSITETTSSDPADAVTIDGTSWDDSDEDFDLEGGGWLKEESSSPISIPLSPDYEDYDADDDETDIIQVQQDSEGNNKKRDSEFLFLSPSDTRLMLEDDDDDQPGLIKVRHTSKNSYSEPQVDNDNSVETADKVSSDDQFVFTIDGDDESDGDLDLSDNKVDSDSDDDSDFVLVDSKPKSDKNDDEMPRRDVREDDDDDDDDNLIDDEDDAVFDSPEEDAQVIYGDHVFLY